MHEFIDVLCCVVFLLHACICRASYFSSTPTDKMYSVVSAVKALYDQLESLEETSIDGDAFLDLWIYVIIKANVKDLVRLFKPLRATSLPANTPFYIVLPSLYIHVCMANKARQRYTCTCTCTVYTQRS